MEDIFLINEDLDLALTNVSYLIWSIYRDNTTIKNICWYNKPYNFAINTKNLLSLSNISITNNNSQTIGIISSASTTFSSNNYFGSIGNLDFNGETLKSTPCLISKPLSMMMLSNSTPHTLQWPTVHTRILFLQKELSSSFNLQFH